LLLAGGLSAGAADAPVKSVAAFTDDELVKGVDKRVGDLQPAAGDRRFDEIGWARDIRTAKRLAREHNRPVFLFTHDGRMNLGRC
jgi:hypothetical protein